MTKKQRNYVNDLHFLSIFDLRRDGHLDAGRFLLNIRWTQHHEQQLVVHVFDDRLIFAVKDTSAPTWTVGLEWTSPYLGGHRPWFSCPACGRRVAKLAIQCRALLCRHCIGEPPYLSKNGGEFESVMDQIVRLRQRYNIKGFCGATIERPRYMHRRKFERIRARLQRLEHEAEILYVRKALAILGWGLIF